MADDIIRVGPEIPKVISVETRIPYTLIVTFKDGTVRETTLKPEELTGVFEPMKDPEYFVRASVDPETRTVAWPNGVDLDPCVLHDPSLLASGNVSEPRKEEPSTRFGTSRTPSDPA